MLPRWIRQTLPATDASTLSPRPKSASGAVAVVTGEPVIVPGAYLTPSTASFAATPWPIGTVESTCTPGPESSTSALYCENVAQFLLASTAATDRTLA